MRTKIIIAYLIMNAFSSCVIASEDRPQDGIQIRIVLFTPSDVEPPKEATEQLKKYADYAQSFFPLWLNNWGYNTYRPMPFSRLPSGELEVVVIKGKHREGSTFYRGENGKIAKGAPERIFKEVKEQSNVSAENQVAWIFLYKILGDDAGLAIGRGSSISGGICYVKFRPSTDFTNNTEISSPQGKDAGLRGAIHELGHALGLPHNGSHYGQRLGSSLMGKPDPRYKKENPNDHRVYLSEASAAMIWKSSAFDGNANLEARNRIPKAQLHECAFSYEPQAHHFKISGKIQSDIRPHSVVVANHPDNGKPSYFHTFFASKVKEGGFFETEVKELEHCNGHLVIAFCFENGFVGGHQLGKKSNIKSGFFRKYQFEDGTFSFGDNWSNKQIQLSKPRKSKRR